MTSKVKVNTIETESGSTLTLGKSGDTVTLASGASQSGFGRTGTVDWDTTAKTASFTAVSGNGYFIDTSSSAITVTLPASPSAGDIVSVSDYALTAFTNNITIARNGSNIDGSAVDLVLNTKGSAVTLVYSDATKGWKPINSNEITGGAKYIEATGGTTSTCGDYRIHTFTGPGTFTVTCSGNPGGSSTVDYLVVAGGGGGRDDGSNLNGGAGGGAGGYRESSGAASGCYTASPLGACVSALPVSIQAYPITVGAGGAAGTNPGANSIFSTITSTGGGGGGVYINGSGQNGGSGGGGGANSGAAGLGNTPPVSPPQGNNGSGGTPGNPGAGGGAGAAASSGTGGNGVTSCISASPTTRGGGGGKGTPGGLGGTGGGGGGGNTSGGGKAGGSGIVIIRYKFQ